MKLKMFGEKSVSTVLFWVFTLLLLVKIGSFLFYVISTIIGDYEVHVHSDYNSYMFEQPLSNNYMIVRMDLKGIVSFVFPFLKNGLLLYLVVLIFKSLKQGQLIFTKKSIKSLKFFAVFNMCMPLVYSLFDILMFQQWVYLNVMPSLPNFIIGVFTLFVLAIFKQGLQLQQENELTI